MPTYVYNCEKCGEFKTLQKITDETLTKCPTCKGIIYRVIQSSIGFVFKGSGFHCNDYKRRR